MSDPVTNIEIEDVLSSIRRLVAESERPVDRASTRAPLPSGDRLVLTPALRVADTPTLPAPPRPVVAEVPVAARAAGLETALSRHAQEWEPDGSEAEPASALAPMHVAVSATPEAETSAEAVLDWSAPAPDDSPVQRAAPPPLTPPSAWPDMDGEDDDTALDDDLALTRAVNRPIGADTARLLATGGIDEDMLRALVFDIVRQELQGTLGERITRNVRKLVRREIYRAISSQELD